MTKQKTTTGRFGELAARHRFALNPHVDYRASRCPGCARPTRRRKFVLSIGVVPGHIVAMGKDCRYCPDCDVIIAHQYGFHNVVVEECTYDRSPICHKVNLFDLHHKYADVMHVEDVLAHLDGLAQGRKVA